MKHVTKFVRIRAELPAKPVDNSANSTYFCIFEIFLFLACLNCVLADFSNFQKIDGVARVRFLSSRRIC
jgi:hypothetical protein